MSEDIKTTNDTKHLTTTEYLGCRDGYDKAELKVSSRYDHWILTLSGGALAISITFLEKIAPHPRPETLWLMTLSWIFFVLSLLFGLISLLTSQSAIREQRQDLDKAYQNQISPVHRDRNYFTITTNLLNWVSAFIFVAGVSCLCVFAVLNAPKKEDKTNVRQQERQQSLNQGLRPTTSTTETGICSATASQANHQTAIPSTTREEVKSGVVK